MLSRRRLAALHVLSRTLAFRRDCTSSSVQAREIEASDNGGWHVPSPFSQRIHTRTGDGLFRVNDRIERVPEDVRGQYERTQGSDLGPEAKRRVG
ncbi:hypothetical protein DFH09DRAFT_1126323 [Mycena vulgaris]|nr:hypothetical protein DFH09DRAFT_1126323 [Mycena vulgaris]